MEEEAIITAVQHGPKTTIGKSLELEFLNVSFRLLRRFKYQDKVCRATLKNPSWLSDLQPSAPLAGYVMEHGEFSARIRKDSRITEGLKVNIEVTDFSWPPIFCHCGPTSQKWAGGATGEGR